MTPVITPFYAALYALFYLYLAKKVINNRWKYKTGLGVVEGELEQTVRVHANFSEYVPFAVILISFLEIQNWRIEVIHGLCITLLISRVLHCLGLTGSKGPSKGRFIGAGSTFLVLLISAGCLIYTYVKTLI